MVKNGVQKKRKRPEKKKTPSVPRKQKRNSLKKEGTKNLNKGDERADLKKGSWGTGEGKKILQQVVRPIRRAIRGHQGLPGRQREKRGE